MRRRARLHAIRRTAEHRSPAGAPRIGRLSVEGLIVVRSEALLREQDCGTVRGDDGQRGGRSRSPPRCREGGEVAEVIGVVMGDRNGGDGPQIQPGVDRSLSRGSPAVDQEPLVLRDHRQRRAAALRIRYRGTATENDDIGHSDSLVDARVEILAEARGRAGRQYERIVEHTVVGRDHRARNGHRQPTDREVRR